MLASLAGAPERPTQSVVYLAQEKHPFWVPRSPAFFNREPSARSQRLQGAQQINGLVREHG